MILEFSVENYRSFRDKQTFSMLPDEGKTEYFDNIFTLSDKYKVLTSAVIYGANASGKSNFMKALESLRDLVIFRGNQPPEERFLEANPFNFNCKTQDSPTVFELDFLIKKIRYRYKVIVEQKYILEEGLYFYPEGKEAKLFFREGQKFTFGDYLKGQKSVVKELTNKNQLFLTKGASNNIQQLFEIYSYFLDEFMPIPFLDTRIDNFYKAIIARQLIQSENDIFFQNFLSLLKSFDTGILNFKIEQLPAKRQFEILFEHAVFDENSIEVETIFQSINEESTGTQKLFVLGGLILRAIMNGRVIMIDEFERSLHPKITKFLIDIFHNPEINKKGAQLIIATHDTNLLSSNEFRRDQIWIVEKDQQGASELFSLADATGILKNANYEKWYLSGRFGGLPGIESLNFELNFKHETEESQTKEV